MYNSSNHRLNNEIDPMECDEDVKEPLARTQDLRLQRSSTNVGSLRSDGKVTLLPYSSYAEHPKTKKKLIP